jgi:type IV pilus assembly protein PilA
MAIPKRITGGHRMRKQKGFSLIELLVVVAIILIIAAIATPSLINSRLAANEASAVGSLRAINTAEVTYFSTYPTFGYTDLAKLGGTGNAPSPTNSLLLDQVLGCPGGVSTIACSKSGYYLIATVTVSDGTVAVGPANTYSINANPIVPSQTGRRFFYSDNSNLIHFATGSVPATSSDLALQ